MLKVKFFQLICFPIFVLFVIIAAIIHGIKLINVSMHNFYAWNDLIHEIIRSTSKSYRWYRIKEMIMMTGIYSRNEGNFL